MTERPPTDAAIVKGFERFEQGFNVWMQWHRARELHPHDEDGARYEAHCMWDAHDTFRQTAIAAQARIDAKKGGAK